MKTKNPRGKAIQTFPAVRYPVRIKRYLKAPYRNVIRTRNLET